MPDVELSAGVLDYEEAGADGPTVVLLHGLVMDASLWRHVVADLRSDHRCVVPTLPLGAHRRPMRPDADLSPRGIGRLEAELLERLDLRDVTLVGNDSGLFQFAAPLARERIARLVITACEAFENFPPGLPGKTVALAARFPGGLNALAQPLRFRPLRRLPVALGLMTKRRVPDEVTDAWLRPALTSREIRRDLEKYLRSCRRGDMLAAADELRRFDRPTLVVWGREDRVMPFDHAQRFVELLPDARLVELDDTYTLIPEDRPAELARAIRDFIRSTA